jgi:hypothetical protein
LESLYFNAALRPAYASDVYIGALGGKRKVNDVCLSALVRAIVNNETYLFLFF